MFYTLLVVIIAALILLKLKSSYAHFKLRDLWVALFLITWAVLFSISLANPFDLYSVSNYAYILLILFVVFFVTGFLVANKRKRIDYDNFYLRLNESAKALNKNKIFNILMSIAVVLCLFYTYKFLSYFSVLSEDSIRSSRFSVGGVFSTVYDYLIFNYYVGSFLWFAKFILAYGLVFGSKNIKSIFYMSLLLCMSSLIFGGGRNILVEIVLMLFCLLVVRKSFLKSIKKVNYLTNIFYASFVFVLFVLATYFRMVNEKLSFSSFYKAVEISFEHIIIYVVGSFRAFDYSLENLYFETGYGVYTFASVNEIYSMFLRLIGFDILPYSQEWGGVLAEQIKISDDINFNALYTIVFNFYNDFGVIGIALFSFLFGWISSKSVSNFLSKANILSLYIVSIFFMSSFLASLVFKLNPANLVITLVIAFIFSKYRFSLR